LITDGTIESYVKSCKKGNNEGDDTMDSKFTQDILNKTVALRNEVSKYAIKHKVT
jgi:hypothetical protein